MRIFKTLSINILVFIIISLFIEIFLRVTFKYDHTYYSVPKKNLNNNQSKKRNLHPYGSIPINSSNLDGRNDLSSVISSSNGAGSVM